MPEKLVYTCVSPRQSENIQVFSFAAKVGDIRRFAKIDRISRDANNALTGFQRPQIASHIREIRAYLEKPGAILPNHIVVAFTSGVEIAPLRDGLARTSIDVSNGPGGLIVNYSPLKWGA